MAKQSDKGLCLGLLNPGAGRSGPIDALRETPHNLEPSSVWVADSPSLELRPGYLKSVSADCA